MKDAAGNGNMKSVSQIPETSKIPQITFYNVYDVKAEKESSSNDTIMDISENLLMK